MDIKWWIGVVENKSDPENRGRIQVRILGIHTKESVRYEKKGIGIPMEDLPWAICCMPLTYGGIAESTVSPPAVMPGAWVIGISLDGDAYQNLLVLGIISIALSPLATHDGSDLGLAQGYQQSTLGITDLDTCKESYTKAIKNLTNSNNSIKANNMLMVLQYIKQKQPEKYANFVKNSGVEITSDTVIAQGTTNDTVRDLLSECYYDYCLDTCGDPVLAALAYNSGYGKAIDGYGDEKSFIQKYGDPRKNEISYNDLASKIASEDIEASNFMKNFMTQLGEDCMNKCVYKISTVSETNNTTSISSTGATISTDVDTSTSNLSKIALPTNSNVITSIYMSKNRPDYSVSKVHMGIDIRARSGDPIRSMSDGKVISLLPSWGGVLIDHGSGIKTRYLHLRKTYVKVGDAVTVGQQIGESGNTGLPQCSAHLHFEVWKNDTKIDPEKFLTDNGIIMTRKKGA